MLITGFMMQYKVLCLLWEMDSRTLMGMKYSTQLVSLPPISIKPLSRENWRLVTGEPVEFEK
jgi:hypothetical protein